MRDHRDLTARLRRSSTGDSDRRIAPIHAVGHKNQGIRIRAVRPTFVDKGEDIAVKAPCSGDPRDEHGIGARQGRQAFPLDVVALELPGYSHRSELKYLFCYQKYR